MRLFEEILEERLKLGFDELPGDEILDEFTQAFNFSNSLLFNFFGQLELLQKKDDKFVISFPNLKEGDHFKMEVFGWNEIDPKIERLAFQPKDVYNFLIDSISSLNPFMAENIWQVFIVDFEGENLTGIKMFVQSKA